MSVQINQGKEDTTLSIPILFTRKEDCCGCAACFAVCPKQAIIMVMDEEGFEYPTIKTELCVHCKRCIRVCPIKRRTTNSLVNCGTI